MITVESSGAMALFAAIKNARYPMRAVAAALEQQTRQSFRRSADPWLGPWPALAPTTIAKRRTQKNPSVQPLIDTGKMFASIHGTSTETSAQVSVGVEDDARASWQQFGTARIPARSFLPIRSSGEDIPENWWSAILEPVNKTLEAFR